VFGKGFGHSEAIALSDRVNHGELLFLDQVVIELPDPLEVAVDGLWLEPLCHEKVDIVRDRPGRHCFNGLLEPEDELPEACRIVFDCIGRVVPSL